VKIQFFHAEYLQEFLNTQKQPDFQRAFFQSLGQAGFEGCSGNRLFAALAFDYTLPKGLKVQQEGVGLLYSLLISKYQVSYQL
jgi:hypothetical protein